jgi:hypothetical protein
MFDFIYDVPNISLAIYFSVFFVTVTWLGIIFLKPFIKLFVGRDPGINELVIYTTSGFSLFYGLLLGLLSVAVYQNSADVERNVFAEASSLASLYRVASNYPDPPQAELKYLLRDYTLYVIYKDWPAHRRGVIYKGGNNRLDAIQYIILQFHPTGVTQEILQTQTLQTFDEFAKARQQRLAGVTTRIPGILWYAVAVGALLNVVLLWMVNARFFAHMLLGGIGALFLGVMIFVIAAMDAPMRGEVSVQPGAYRLVYDVMMRWDEEV